MPSDNKGISAYVPLPQNVGDYEASLQNAGVEYVFHRHDGAGHAFQWAGSPERFCVEQSEDLWVKTLASFDVRLE